MHGWKRVLGAAFGAALLAGCGGGEDPGAKLAPPQASGPPSLQSVGQPRAMGWMHPDVPAAWAGGDRGAGATIAVVDDFLVGETLAGRIGGTQESRRHGDWVQIQAHLVAPDAVTTGIDWTDRARPVPLAQGATVINASFAWQGPTGQTLNAVLSTNRQIASIVDHARTGQAVVVKAAGNAGVPVGTVVDGRRDYLNDALAGQPGAIIVGALTRNGTVGQPAPLASYSNTAGTSAAVQERFLVAGVDSQSLGLAGTSFAAPVVSGYAAIVGGKFREATGTEIANRLLSTARTDTVQGYSAAIHGRGEASLSRALAPVSIQ